jgi:hypothetical protein
LGIKSLQTIESPISDPGIVGGETVTAIFDFKSAQLFTALATMVPGFISGVTVIVFAESFTYFQLLGIDQ